MQYISSLYFSNFLVLYSPINFEKYGKKRLVIKTNNSSLLPTTIVLDWSLMVPTTLTVHFWEQLPCSQEQPYMGTQVSQSLHWLTASKKPSVKALPEQGWSHWLTYEILTQEFKLQTHRIKKLVEVEADMREKEQKSKWVLWPQCLHCPKIHMLKFSPPKSGS